MKGGHFLSPAEALAAIDLPYPPPQVVADEGKMDNEKEVNDAMKVKTELEDQQPSSNNNSLENVQEVVGKKRKQATVKQEVEEEKKGNEEQSSRRSRREVHRPSWKDM